ncbi:hypothetical protein ACOI1H_20405 [Loktanella sp. DJP18]|uniref:hypothetical protein n=1 Tax=Loktanella sp. DJP18 TaxID=3409788 RepID=UPI003BB5897A
MAGDEERDELFEEVVQLCSHLGYDLTPSSERAADISLQSNYTKSETASLLVSAALAWDVREHFIQHFNVKKVSLLAQHGLEALKVLRSLAESGNIRRELWQNDARAIMVMTSMDHASAGMIERVLNDEVVSGNRVGVSRVL